MKILISGDKHLGLVSDGIPRLPEQTSIIAETIGFLYEYEPDVFVDLGDLFDVARPTPETSRWG